MRLKRAYIMLEALMAGGIVAVGLGTTITLIAGSRYDSSTAARRAEASAYAMALADSVMSSSTTTAVPLSEVPDHNSMKAGLVIEETPLLASSSVPPLQSSSRLHKIVVTVEFATGRGPQRLVYERLRRSVP